jgi:hypothetical protein
MTGDITWQAGTVVTPRQPWFRFVVLAPAYKAWCLRFFASQAQIARTHRKIRGAAPRPVLRDGPWWYTRLRTRAQWLDRREVVSWLII